MPYDRPPLSKPDGDGVIERPIRGGEELVAQRIKLTIGVAVTKLDRERQMVMLSDGGSLAYGRLLLATGARPRKLDCNGGERAMVFRTLADAKAIYAAASPKARVVIIGAGLIGLELAAVLGGEGVPHRGCGGRTTPAWPQCSRRFGAEVG